MEPLTVQWPTEVREAVAVQQVLRRRIRLEDDPGPLATVAGVDTAFPKRGGEPVARCAVVVLSFPDLRLLGEAAAEVPVMFPYVPGLLAFREGPAIVAALAQLPEPPDLLMFDGHGYAHPRRIGIASHLGVLLDRPAIGCAKSILTGHADEPGPEPGDRAPLLARDGELLGYALRTRARTRPVYVSPGHRVSFATAADLVMACVRGRRLPEPTRLADHLSKGSVLR
ncbi:MAG: deoxyribonuclease V [Armatimonadetes bacterium]|nr:deoxyribonuclease V [Armatimonadota bacterium]